MTIVTGRLATTITMLPRFGRCFCNGMVRMFGKATSIRYIHGRHLPGMDSIHWLSAHYSRACHAIGEEAEQQGENEQIAFHVCKRRSKGIFLSIGFHRFYRLFTRYSSLSQPVARVGIAPCRKSRIRSSRQV